MLRELHVRNLAVLAGAAVEFGGGLNVLTGETGAGKSIVVDSLNLLIGGRASSDLIRTGADTLTVSGVFEPEGNDWRGVLEAAGLEAEGEQLLIRREVSRNGRNRAFVNDQPATLRVLNELAPLLLRIHGQRDELGLISPELQRSWLDRSGGAEAQPLLERTAQAYQQVARLGERLATLTGDQQVRHQRLDLLRFQAAEIDSARLQAGEEDDLRLERDQLRNREALVQGLSGPLDLLFENEGAVAESLARSRHLLEDIVAWEPAAEGWCQELEELRIRTEELASSLRDRLDGLEADPARLDHVEDRLATLERLCRKYQGSTADILARRREIAAELEALEDDAADVDELRRRLDRAVADFRAAALELSAGRARWGQELVRRMARELKDLGLDQARLEVTLERRRRADSPLRLDGEAVEISAAGIDQVSFLFAPNPGEQAQPLARIASGGELSRLSLALQLAARGETETSRPTLVFDEVDTGIGGAEGAALGSKLQRLAQGGQILAVTHLPQVASHGDHHFKVAKQVRDGRTYAQVESLDPQRRVEEVARMLGGETITEISRSHAQELLAAGTRGRPAEAAVEAS